MTKLEIHELTCGYGKHPVLEQLSLAARAGEVLALLGPNGAGKTTLLRAMAGLLRPNSGKVILQDRDTWDLRPGELARHVALAPQMEQRDWPLSVEHSVLLGRAPHRGWLLPYTENDHKVVDQALQDTGLTELRTRPITKLSGGEWRRMILARALAQEASVLLLDEPTAGLDFKYQLEILRLVRRLATEQQLIVVLTLHDLNYAALYADRIAVLSERSLVAVGSPEQVLTVDIIGQTYGISVALVRHPVYGTPMIVPLSDPGQSDS